MDRTENVISLCTGAGGLDLGLKLAVPSSRVVVYVEIEAACCELLATRMEEGSLDPAPIWTDLTSFDARPFHGLVDGVIGGYPCQPFSAAGRRQGVEDPRHLWPHVARILRESGATWGFFENVANHLNLGYREVREELEGMGYRVTQGLFTAREVADSQGRGRLFILAYLDGERPPSARSAGQCELCPKVIAETHHRSHHTSVHVPGAHSQGLQIAERTESQGQAQHHKGGATPQLRGALFPPGPRDYRGWAEVLGQSINVAPALSEAEIESSLCGVVDGLARGVDIARTDRLRAGGNGVVPLQAAYAYSVLRRDFD